MGRPAPLAKLTRPKLHAAYLRERLFAWLDGQRDRPVAWIAGPPGAGKTTLAASWLEARALPCLWYQLDAGDADPATFFFYLRRAAEAAGAKGKPPLPLLTAEYRADVPGFARRWFREVFQRLPRGTVLALDDYQEVPADSALHAALASASLEVPEPSQLLVLSWVEPPAEFSRLLADERLSRLDPRALRLGPEEAEGIASGRDRLAPEQIREICERCGGWAAGFTLLRERTRRTGLVNRIDQRASMQEVFDYFMAQVFRDVPPDARETLVKLALLPRFTESMACELSGSAAAGGLLDGLYRRHLFVERRWGGEPTYEFHQLFRAFLRDQARRHHAPLGLAELSRRAAALLERAGMPEDAVPLLLAGGDHTGAARLVEALAPLLAGSGRGGLLEEWLGRLPAEERDRRPWLSYWLGAAIAGTKIPDARSAYERAHEGFVREANRAGQAMAVAGVLQTYFFEMDDVSGIQRWLPLVDSLFSEEPAFPSKDVAARTYGTLVGILFWSVPTHPLLPVFVERLHALLTGPLSPDVKVTAGGLLAEYCGLAGLVGKAEHLTAAIEPLAGEASPLAQAYWGIRSCRGAYRTGDFATVRRKVRAALAMVEENGLQVGPGLVYGLLADVAMDLGELEEVPRLVEKLRAWSQGRRHAIARLHWMQAKLSALTGDLVEAARECEAASAVGGNALALGRFAYRITLASIRTELGELDRAREALDDAKGLYSPERFPLLASSVQFAEAVLAAAAHESGWQEPVRKSLRLFQELGVKVLAGTQPLLARRLVPLLLSEGIEVPYVRACVRAVGMAPPKPDVPGWPWAVQVRTLGPFAVELDGEPLAFSGKVPRKPLELLQALVAFGPDAPAETLGNALWPDSDGDAADAALRVTLSRLRRILEHDVVTLHQGRLSLDGRACWVDAWALDGPDALSASDSQDGRARRLLELYRGPFLQGEREQPWMLGARERLRRRFAAAAARTGEALEREGRGAEAIALYRGALERDEIPEEIRRRLASALAAVNGERP